MPTIALHNFFCFMFPIFYSLVSRDDQAHGAQEEDLLDDAVQVWEAGDRNLPVGTFGRETRSDGFPPPFSASTIPCVGLAAVSSFLHVSCCVNYFFDFFSQPNKNRKRSEE